MLNHYSSAQHTTSSNDGLTLISRGFFDTSQDPPNDFAPSTDHDGPTLGDTPANDAPDTEETESIRLSSIETTSTTQEESRSSATTLSAVDIPRPTSDQPKVAEQNGFRFVDW